ncbi:Glyoxalase/bleomycin resistance protein/dioxygenase [[Leptolyngbya] sp. PCC 7376]|uniref:VOC family protein n=1 Tax=[Leptolyngbya] sp. PCC 7376 TaxID=111781 RepID=UPI00029EF435|nr:VOC family protein [[Leptolyngbya] sp. PCC 7376]AFY39182.1 Glyoxalase/bleomycin resistance protein/dioxygenase [[Leptolyngbya] sp. PCC 7376]
MHHISIRTADIHRAIAFYGLLGFTTEVQFTTGYSLACWLQGELGRIELIQIPEPKPAPDAFGDEHYVGYYHISFDLTELTESLPDWLAKLQTQSTESIKVLLKPQQQMIGDRIYEVMFLADPDGLPLEFIRLQGENS